MKCGAFKMFKGDLCLSIREHSTHLWDPFSVGAFCGNLLTISLLNQCAFCCCCCLMASASIFITLNFASAGIMQFCRKLPNLTQVLKGGLPSIMYCLKHPYLAISFSWYSLRITVPDQFLNHIPSSACTSDLPYRLSLPSGLAVFSPIQ